MSEDQEGSVRLNSVEEVVWSCRFCPRRRLWSSHRERATVDRLRAVADYITKPAAGDSRLRAVAADGSLQTLDRFNPYRLGHYMGHDVHGSDTGWDWRSPLQPGQALTIEPGMYVASEGIGLRVEDDYWVGATSLECLSCALPRWPEEIEAVMDAGRAGPAAVSLAPLSRTLPVSPWSLGRPHMLPRAQPER